MNIDNLNANQTVSIVLVAMRSSHWCREQLQGINVSKENGLKKIRRFMKTWNIWQIEGRRPDWQELSPVGSNLNHTGAKWNSLWIEEGLLRKWKATFYPSKRKIHEVVRYFHDSSSVGQLEYIWPWKIYMSCQRLVPEMQRLCFRQWSDE